MNGLGCSDLVPEDPRTTVLRPFASYIDWLTLNMRAPASLWATNKARPWRFDRQHLDERALWLVPTEHSTAHFGRVFYLEDATGAKLVTFVAVPHSEAIHHPEDCQVQFENSTLYGGLWWSLYDMLRRAGFEYRGISRLDIAADGLAGHGGDYQSVLDRAIFTGEGRYYGKGKWQPTFFRRKVDQFLLGTNASDKRVKCYDKTRELKTRGGAKDYIADAWNARLGFDPYRDGQRVNRLELRVKGKELRDYFPRERSGGILEDIRSADHRGDILKSMVPSLFDFRTHAGRARDAVPLAVFDWSELTRTGNEAFERRKKTLALSAHSVKVTIRTLYMVHLKTGDADTLRECVKMAHGGGAYLHAWWEAARARWVKVHANLINRSENGFDVGLWDQFTI